MSFLSQLNWRYATRAFDTAKPVSKDLETRIVEAARLAPTSFGLQPLHITVVSSEDLKAKLGAAAWGQPQFTTASSVLVFSYRTDLEDRAEKFIDMALGGDTDSKIAMEGYAEMIRGSVKSKDAELLKNWASKQAYIGLGFALAAAAELEVDSCPMEGFDPASFKTILELPEHFEPVVTMAIGYRPEGVAVRPKTRFSPEDMVDYR